MTKTYRHFRVRYSWRGMKNDIKVFIRKCKSCEKQKLERAKIPQLMFITDNLQWNLLHTDNTRQLSQKLHSCCDSEHRSHNNSRCLCNDFNLWNDLWNITRNLHRQRNKLFSLIQNQSFIRFSNSYILWEVKYFITVKF